jgi:hypothetical protein
VIKQKSLWKEYEISKIERLSGKREGCIQRNVEKE